MQPPGAFTRVQSDQNCMLLGKLYSSGASGLLVARHRVWKHFSFLLVHIGTVEYILPAGEK